MKYSFHKLIIVSLSIALVAIPFFWLEPGWMDLGGDSSRLYFYDALNYLRGYLMYGVEPTGTGFELTSYYLIPFVALLWGLGAVIQSPYLLITLFNSMTLVVSFLSIYGIVGILIGSTKDQRGHALSSMAAILAGVLYVFSPILIHTGWDKALVVHNGVFLNPLLFYLGLRYVVTKNVMHILPLNVTNCR